MRMLRLSAFCLSGVLLLVPTRICQAQPEDTPAQENQPQTPEEKKLAQQKAVDEAIRQGQEKAKELLKLPPAEQRRAVNKMMEEQLLKAFDQAGFNDPNFQKVIVDFINAQEVERDKVRAEGLKLHKALAEAGKGAPAQDLSILLSNYLGAVEDAKEQREEATRALDAEIGFSKNPKLMATLTLFGLIGDASAYTGGLTLSGMMSIGNLYTLSAPAPAVH